MDEYTFSVWGSAPLKIKHIKTKTPWYISKGNSCTSIWLCVRKTERTWMSVKPQRFLAVFPIPEVSPAQNQELEMLWEGRATRDLFVVNDPLKENLIPQSHKIGKDLFKKKDDWRCAAYMRCFISLCSITIILSHGWKGGSSWCFPSHEKMF